MREGACAEYTCALIKETDYDFISYKLQVLLNLVQSDFGICGMNGSFWIHRNTRHRISAVCYVFTYLSMSH